MTVFQLGWAGACAVGHTRQVCPAEYVPLLFISFLGLIFGGSLYFFQNFFQTAKTALDSFMN